MTTLDHRTAVDGARLRPALAALVHLLALGTAVGTFAGIGRWRPDVYQHDRFGYALVAGLATGALLAALVTLAVPRPLRPPYLAGVGIGLLPSFAAALIASGVSSTALGMIGTLLPSGTFALEEALGAGVGIAVGTAAGGLAGSDPCTRLLALPVGAVVLGTLGGGAALLLWVAAALYQ